MNQIDDEEDFSKSLKMIKKSRMRRFLCFLVIGLLAILFIFGIWVRHMMDPTRGLVPIQGRSFFPKPDLTFKPDIPFLEKPFTGGTSLYPDLEKWPSDDILQKDEPNWPKGFSGIHANGNLVALYADRIVVVLDLEKKRELYHLPFGRANLGLGSFASSPILSSNNRFLAVGGQNAQLWDLFTGKMLNDLPHEGAVTGLCFFDEAQLATIEIDPKSPNKSSLKFWDINSGKLAKKIEFGYPVMGLIFDPNRKTIYTWSFGLDTLQLLDAASGKILKHIPAIPCVPRAVRILADGPHVLGECTADGNFLALANLKDGTIVRRAQFSAGRMVLHAWSRDGKFAAFSKNAIKNNQYRPDGNIHILDVEKWKEIGFLQGVHSNLIQFVQDGKNLLTVGEKGIVKMWDLTNLNIWPSSTARLSF
jgi:WD40 repeat protein